MSRRTLRRLFGWSGIIVGALVCMYGLAALVARLSGQRLAGFFAHPQLIPALAPAFTMLVGLLALFLARRVLLGHRGAAVLYATVFVGSTILRSYIPAFEVENHLVSVMIELPLAFAWLALALAIDIERRAERR